jgi:simple sugar transport system ATP-binding protein
MLEKPYIELKNITKSFGEVQANRSINLEIYKGEIHALLGENGSGKTTLMNILTGVYSQDKGRIFIDGKEAVFYSPADSLRAGIGMIHQHVELVEVLSVAQNITAGIDKGAFIHPQKLNSKINALSDTLGFKVDPNKKVYQLSVGEKQTVEILKVFYRGVNVLILDEPTSVLTPQESRLLFETLIKMKCEGCAIVLITHKMNEVFEVSDKVTVLRKGEALCTLVTSETTQQELTEKMVGKAISLDIPCTPTSFEKQAAQLEIQNLVVQNKQGKRLLDNVSLTVNKGEIHGVAGIAGSGQKELCEAIAGLKKIKSGHILLKGRDITGMSPRRLNKEKITIAFVPEDRMNMGLAGGLSITDNVMLRSVDKTNGLFLDSREGKEKTEEIIDKYEISTSGPSQIVKNLSGGNIQKVLLGREMEQDPDFIITAYPVRGLDVGATNFVYDVLNEEKCRGMGILFVGEDLDVLMHLCDRISVLHAGKLMGSVDAKTITKNEIGLMMTGVSKEAAHA